MAKRSKRKSVDLTNGAIGNEVRLCNNSLGQAYLPSHGYALYLNKIGASKKYAFDSTLKTISTASNHQNLDEVG